MFQRLFLITFWLVSVAHASEEINVKLVEDIVESYQQRARETHQKDITLDFFKTKMFAATALISEDKIEMSVWGDMISKLTPPQLTFVICHELGHIFGKINFNHVPKHHTPYLRINAIEAEGDYFAGQCMLKAYEDFLDIPESDRVSLAKESVIQTLSIGHRGLNIFPEAAKNDVFNGINPGYPDPNCRALTAHNGIDDLPRPKCWYNPGKKKGTR